MTDTTKTMNKFTVTYNYNGKELVLGDLLKDHISNKDLNIASWKAIQFFEARIVDREAVAA